MKYLDTVAGALVLGLRLLWIPLGQTPTDWVVAVAIFWIARSLAPENSRTRDLLLAGLGLWLTALYAWNQGPETWALATGF